MVCEVGLLGRDSALDVRFDVGVVRPATVCVNLRDRDGGQDADDRDDHQKLDQGKAPLGLSSECAHILSLLSTGSYFVSFPSAEGFTSVKSRAMMAREERPSPWALKLGMMRWRSTEGASVWMSSIETAKRPCRMVLALAPR